MSDVILCPACNKNYIKFLPNCYAICQSCYKVYEYKWENLMNEIAAGKKKEVFIIAKNNDDVSESVIEELRRTKHQLELMTSERDSLRIQIKTAYLAGITDCKRKIRKLLESSFTE